MLRVVFDRGISVSRQYEFGYEKQVTELNRICHAQKVLRNSPSMTMTLGRGRALPPLGQ